MEDCLHAILSWHWNMQFYGDCSRTADQSRMQSMIRILRFKISDIWLAFLARILTDGRQTNYELGIQMVHPSNAATISKLVQQTYALPLLDICCNSICGKRLLFITEAGHIGTGPLWTKPGDTVHRISRLPLPMVLRKQHQGGVYRVVGAAMTSQELEKGFSWLRRLECITLV
jgi:hypothetical protein